MPDPKITVLVVEDEVLVRMDIADQLADRGFTVAEAGSARAALLHLQTHPDVQVVFTDIDMPGGMDGLMLASEVRKRWPAIQIVVTSGHWQMREHDLPVHGRFITKPYQAEDIVQAITGLLAASS